MILALDTATRFISIALHDGDAVLAESAWRTRDHHTVELAPAVQALMHRLGVAPGDLSGVAVAIGPGSFTGLRIGLGLAKGLALARGLKVWGAPTLDILAFAQPPRPEPMIAALQAGRGKIAAAAYRWQADAWPKAIFRWCAQAEPRVTDWASLAADIREPTYVCGEIDRPGLAALRRLRGKALIARPAHAVRRAAFLAELAWARARAGESDDPAGLAPIYLHYPQDVQT